MIKNPGLSAASCTSLALLAALWASAAPSQRLFSKTLEPVAVKASSSESGVESATHRAENEELSREAARALENSSSYTQTSITQGRKHYLRLCQNCHGKDGKALDNFDFEATDLTVPGGFLYGATDGEIFRSIRQGAGYDMPAFAQQLETSQIWDLVNFIRSLGPETSRPTNHPERP